MNPRTTFGIHFGQTHVFVTVPSFTRFVFRNFRTTILHQLLLALGLRPLEIISI
jgi:hypothetical protein